METKKIGVNQVVANKKNPRTITGEKFEKLVMSILVLPKMLELRPIVIDEKHVALGGNMRTLALQHIASKLSPEQIEAKLNQHATFNAKTSGEQKAVLKWWKDWFKSPFAYVVDASTLSKEEREEFVVKDNVSFGQWDWDALANTFDNSALADWGMDVWQPEAFATSAPSAPAAPSSEPAASENDGAGKPSGELAPIASDNPQFSGLPAELQGLDLKPTELPKLEGTNETALDRIIIVFPRERKEELLNLIGLASLDKVVYKLEEIIPEA